MRPDEEATLIACVEAVGRAGAKDCEVGFLWDDEEPPPGWPAGKPVTPEAAGWYVTAHWKGALLKGEGIGPAEAAIALAVRMLHGGKCVPCGKKINLKPSEGRWSEPECLWRLEGKHWLRGCDGGHGGQNRAARRKKRR